MTDIGQSKLSSFFMVAITFVIASCLCGCASHSRNASADSETLSPDNVQDEAQAGKFSSALKLSSGKVPNGSLTMLSFERPADSSCDDFLVEFSGAAFYVWESVKQGRSECRSYVAVSYHRKPGLEPIILKSGLNSGGGRKVAEVPLLVIEGKYRSEKLDVDPSHVNPPAKVLERIKSESEEVGKLYSRVTRKKYWDGKFRMPLKVNRITSAYGNNRVFNGELRSFHQGIDLKARTNTSVLAIGPGEVVLAKHLYFSGNSVIIDHGYGIFSIYAHMNSIKVKVGDVVRMRQLLGKSGMTGRSSGPHLHLGTVISNVKVNPIEFFKSVE